MTRLLHAWNAGDPGAQDELVAVVYSELHRRASQYLRHERVDHTLQPTALVDDVCMALLGTPAIDWQDRGHFLRTAARLMRRILVDHARARRTMKRGGISRRVELDEALATAEQHDIDVYDLDDALKRLEAVSPRASRIVTLRFFMGLTIDEIADVLEVAPATVKRDWEAARLWLHDQLEPPSGDGSRGD